MVVIVMDNVSESIRGECTKWLQEIKTGTFVGNINATVRNLLWEHLCSETSYGGAMMIFNYNNEQGFEIQTFGITKKEVETIDDIKLIRTLHKPV